MSCGSSTKASPPRCATRIEVGFKYAFQQFGHELVMSEKTEAYLELVKGVAENIDQFVEDLAEMKKAEAAYRQDGDELARQFEVFGKKYCATLPATNKAQHAARLAFDPLGERIKGLIKQIDLLPKRIGAAGPLLSHDIATARC